MPPFLNQMIVHIATPRIRDELRKLGLNVSDRGFFNVELYSVTVSNESTTDENHLRAVPGGYLIYTVIVEPPQDPSALSPQFIVRTVEVLSMSPRRYLMAHETPVRRMLQAEDPDEPEEEETEPKDIPGSEKFSFNVEIDASWWQWDDKKPITRSYYRRLPPEGVEIKGILIRNFGWYYTSGWYAGVCCVDDHRIDDVEYTKTILERENKNNLPVYGYGYSNGGMMVESLLCHKVIQGAVAVNGVLALEPGLQGSFDTCDDIYNDANFGPKPPVPRVVSIHCIDDEVVPYNGSELNPPNPLSPWPETKFPRTNRDIRRWAGRLGCARKETTKTKLNDEMTLKEWKCPGEERAVSIKTLY
ncbi:hypothetical protein FOZ61_008952 [Perkinsus olseni]|nr:hypothetical protein FOZ61_008952 [Perkinsus olseni]